MMRWAFPHALWLLTALPAWWAASRWLDRSERRRLERFCGPRLAEDLTSGNRPRARAATRTILAVAAASAMLGLAKPQALMTSPLVTSEGIDILLLADTSRSMQAADPAPSRLTRARRAMRYLAGRLTGERVGLIQFAGEAFVQCPLTRDTGALTLMIHSLEAARLPVDGTDLGGAVDFALRVFGQTGARHRALVILSDGEQFGRAPFAQVEDEAAKGLRVFCLGVGSPAGAPVPPDADGRPAPPGSRTKLDEAPLKQLAQISGGRYVRLTAAGQEEAEILRELRQMEKIQRYAEQGLAWKDIFPWFAALAAACLAVTLLINHRPGPAARARARPWWRRWWPAGLALLLLWPPPAWALGHRSLDRGHEAFARQNVPEAERWYGRARQSKPGYPLAEFDYGCALLYQYKFEEALQAFIRARSRARGKLLEDCWYNTGYTLFYVGLREGAGERWQAAADAYIQLLLLNPRDADARYNLELILREIDRQSQDRARREEQAQGGESGDRPGGGADRPGPDRLSSPARTSDDAPPREREETTAQRQDQNAPARPSDSGWGRHQRGMSQETALRTLRSLEEQEQVLQEPRPGGQPPSPEYQGPPW